MVIRALALAAATTALVPRPLCAQLPPTPKSIYADTLAKEQAVRAAFDDGLSPEALLRALRTVVDSYEALAREHPAGGYGDYALWNGGRLALEAHRRFGDREDHEAAVRLLRALQSEYPSSRLARQVPGIVRARAPAPPSTPRPTAVSTRSRRTKPARPAATNGRVLVPARLATLTGIERETFPDSVRITIALDREVPFYDERLSDPDRVFIDLSLTRVASSLREGVVRFEDDEHPVQQVRLGRRPNQTTRVVLDAPGIATYSVYSLYEPFRLVIDCVRAASLAARFDEGSDVEVPPGPLPSRRIAATFSSFAAPPGTKTPAGADGKRPAQVPPLPARALPSLSSAPRAPRPVIQAPSRNLAGGLSMARQLGLSVSRIVIDPGHGGHDPGAKGRNVAEAELVLDVALRLEKLLREIPGTEVILTRRTDEFVALEERTAIANREAADLFLSIHANASNNTQAHGVETYFLNFATNLSAAAVAARENAASGQAMGALPDFVKAIALNNKLDESRDFATYMQRALVETLRPTNKQLRDLGVKQAPFAVLIGAAMPSVLAEISFVTNAQEAKLLRSATYRQRIAEALLRGIRRYQSALKSVGKVAASP